MSLSRFISNLIHRPPKLSKEPVNHNAATIHRQAAYLEDVGNQTQLTVNGDRIEFESPVVGADPLVLSDKDGQLRATYGNQELEVDHRRSSRFSSSGSAIGFEPAKDSIELPNGREVTISKRDRSWQVMVKDEDSPLELRMWFQKHAGAPTSVRFQQPGLVVRLAKEGLTVREQPTRGGPTHGHLTSMRDGEFVSKDWTNGFCRPALTSQQDVDDLVQGATQLLSDGRVLLETGLS